MEALNNIVFEELSRSGYKTVKGEYIWKHSLFSDYWIVKDFQENLNIESIQDIQEGLFEEIKNLRDKYVDIEKNTSLLILNKVENKSDEMVISVENDVFYFKKYVIQYTETELESILLYKKKRPEDSIAKLVADKKIFTQIKQDLHNPLCLFYTIAQKLPFIVMDTDKKEFNADLRIDGLDAESLHLLEWVDSISDFEDERPSEDQKKQAQKDILKFLK